MAFVSHRYNRFNFPTFRYLSSFRPNVHSVTYLLRSTERSSDRVMHKNSKPVYLSIYLSIDGKHQFGTPKNILQGRMTPYPCSSRLHVFICCYRQVAYLKFEVRVMAVNDLVAEIYQCLHEMCTTLQTNTKVQFGYLLSTVLSSTKN